MNFHQFFSHMHNHHHFHQHQHQHQHNNQQVPKDIDNNKFYKILGIEKNATSSQIRKAYLSKSIKGPFRHPDRGGDENKFKELSLAYNTLFNEKSKKLYDKYGEASLKQDFVDPENRPDIGSLFGFGNRQQNTEMKKSQPIVKQIDISLEDVCNGLQKIIPVRKQIIVDSNGIQITNNDYYEKCPKCAGNGVIQQIRQVGPGMLQQIQVPCEDCRRSGFIIKPDYMTMNIDEELDVFIPKGSKSGDKLKFRDKGNIIPGCLPGDIVLIINIKNTTEFKRKENDLLLVKHISIKQALCGINLHIKHPDGRILKIKHNQIIHPDQLNSITDGGLPLKDDPFKSGKLFILFKIKLYNTISSERRSILAKIFNDIETDNNLSFNDDIHIDPEQYVEDCCLINASDNEYGSSTNNYTHNATEVDSDDDDHIPMGQPQQCRTM